MKKTVFSLFLCFYVYCQGAVSQDLSAQGPAAEATPKAYGSYIGDQFDSINLENGKLMLNIPVFSYPQRGGRLQLGVHFQYDPVKVTANGFVTGGGLQMVENADVISDWLGDPGRFVPANYMLTTSTGQHVLNQVVGGNSYITVDGSGYQLTSAGYIDRFGTVTAFHDPPETNGQFTSTVPVSWIAKTTTDSNGNKIELNAIFYPYPGETSGWPDYSGWTDTMGRYIPFPGADDPNSLTRTWPGTYDAGTGTTTRTWTVPGLYSGNVTYTFVSQDQGYVNGPCVVVPAYPTNCASTTQGNPSDLFSPGSVLGTGTTRISSLHYPDGTKWQFVYDLAGIGNNDSLPHWGDLVKIVSPQGGAISYTWDSIPSFVPRTVTSSDNAYYRTVTTKTVDSGDGTSPVVWHFDLKPVNSGAGSITVSGVGASDPNGYGPYAMVVTTPSGDQTLHVFEPVGGDCGYYETITNSYAGPVLYGTLLTHKVTAYAHSSNADIGNFGYRCRYNAVWPTTITSDNQQQVISQTALGPQTSAGGSSPESTFLDLPQEIQYTDMTTGKILNVSTSYAWQGTGGSAFLNAGLLQTPTSIITASVDPSTNVHTTVSQTTIAYDESSYLQSAGIYTQHVASPVGERGNPTTVSRWRNTDNTFLPTHTAWYDTGMPAQQIDANNNALSTVLYSSTYAGAYPTEVDDAVGHPAISTYDFNTGMKLSQADPNMVAAGTAVSKSYYTTGTYQIGRIATVTYPDGGMTTYSYPDPNTVTIQKKIDSLQTLSLQTRTDGLGRIVSGSMLNVPISSGCSSGTVHQDQTYDFAGRIKSMTRPYCTLSDDTLDIRYTNYDALGRPIYIYWQGGHTHSADSPYYTFTYPTLNQTVTLKSFGQLSKRTYDATGHLLTVLEQSDQAQDRDDPVVETDYSYDALGDLVFVSQHGDPSHSPVEAPTTRSLLKNSFPVDDC